MDVATQQGKYIYCIIKSSQPRTFGPRGIGGRGDELHTVCFNDISAVVSNAPIGKYRVSRENSLAHEKAIEEVMTEYATLPVRFATVAEDEEKVRRILEKEYDCFRDLLSDIEDKTELGLKAIFKEGVIYKQILEKYEDIRILKEKIAIFHPERSHYQRIKVGKMVEHALLNEKQMVKDEILNSLSPLAVEVKTSDTYGELMIVNATFLVEKAKEIEFDSGVRRLDDKYDEKVTFRYIGGLPPFNFVNVMINIDDY